MDKFESLSHTMWECKYHIVFIPKCRERMVAQTLRGRVSDSFQPL
jgi:putative transposase